MGKLFSKHVGKNSKTDGIRLQDGLQNAEHDEQYEIYDPDKYDLQAVEELKKEFKYDPETFILNMLLMSFMFFDNFEEEIHYLANTSSEIGKKLNSELIQDHQKQILMPDSIFESVNKRVKFIPSRRPKKDAMEPLVTQRLYVLHDTIEIEDKKDNRDYSRIDKPTYRAAIEDSKEHKGFVKVNLLGSSGIHVTGAENRSPSVDSASSTSSAKLNQRKSDLYVSHKTSLEDVHDSGFNTAVNSESDYDYTRITEATTPRKLLITEKDAYTSINHLPSKCITPVKVRNEDFSDSESDEDNEDAQKLKKRPLCVADLFRTRYYLSSCEFMTHFKNNVFPNYLGRILRFSDEEITQATSIPGAIYCNSVDAFGSDVYWEVIPSISMPWPDEIAFEWTLRRRRTVWDRREKKPIAYKWPTQKMVDEVNKLSCVVIPKGFIPKKEDNPSVGIEWEVGFPKAERYLEFRMSHAQIKTFLYIIILHKHLIEPSTHSHGLLIEHMRSLMFWQCEANYKAWPEDKLGTKLKFLLKILYDHLGKASLPNYFIRARNMLQNVPRKYLIPAQDAIHRVLESPLPHLLSALKNLSYMPGRFYPKPNLDELYRILTEESVLRKEAQLLALAQEKAKREFEARRRENEHSKMDKEQRWHRRLMEEHKRMNSKKVAKAIDNSTNLSEQQSESSESINLHFSVKRIFEEDIARQILLLTFFIQHFILIAKRSLRISTTSQTLFYLKQSWYLTMVLEDIDYENAQKFQEQIREEEENCQKKKVGEPKIPSTPKRNSSFFANDILQVRGKEINMVNLTKSYNAKIISDPMPSTSGIRRKPKMRQKPIPEKQYHTEDSEFSDEDQTTQNIPNKSIVKSVAFKNLDGTDNDTDDQLESTTL